MGKKKMDAFSDEEFAKIVSQNLTYSDILRDMGYSGSGNASKTLKERISSLGLDISHLDATKGKKKVALKISDEDWFVKGKFRKNQNSKVRMLQKGIKNECSVCSLPPFWNGKELVLQVDHIDGDNSNNELINLRLICPNCHTQTDNFGSKNIDFSSRESNCSICRKRIGNKTKTGKCVQCLGKERSKKPDDLELVKKQVKEIGYSATGRFYGVSDNAVRKWIK